MQMRPKVSADRRVSVSPPIFDPGAQRQAARLAEKAELQTHLIPELPESRQVRRRAARLKAKRYAKLVAIGDRKDALEEHRLRQSKPRDRRHKRALSPLDDRRHLVFLHSAARQREEARLNAEAAATVKPARKSRAKKAVAA